MKITKKLIIIYNIIRRFIYLNFCYIHIHRYYFILDIWKKIPNSDFEKSQKHPGLDWGSRHQYIIIPETKYRKIPKTFGPRIGLPSQYIIILSLSLL